MKSIKVTFSNGDYLVTSINGTDEEIKEYYLNKNFNLGNGEHDLIVSAEKVEFLGEININYPRFFTHVQGFNGCSAYLKVDSKSSEAKIVYKNGSETNSSYFWEGECEECVRKGIWKELSAEQAEKLVDKVANIH